MVTAKMGYRSVVTAAKVAAAAVLLCSSAQAQVYPNVCGAGQSMKVDGQAVIGGSGVSGRLYLPTLYMNHTLVLGRYGGYSSIRGDNSASGGNLCLDAYSSSSAVMLGNYVAGNVCLVGAGGKVIVGSGTPTEKLHVLGNVKADTLKVIAVKADKVFIKTWSLEVPDYVFSREYHLRPASEVEDYIQKHEHLPGVPSAGEMKQGNVDLVALNMTLLKKVEELTLYMIKQDKEIDALRTAVKAGAQGAEMTTQTKAE